MKAFTKIFSILTVVITIYVAVFAGIMVIPRAFGIMPYIVLSGSMAPAIPSGSVAFINQKDRDVEIDDIITYKLGEEASIETGNGKFTSAEKGMLVTHRVIDISDDGYLMTKGDANEVTDLSLVNQSQVVGTYKTHIPKLGFLMSKLSKKMMVVLFAGVILLNIAASILSWAWEGDEEKKKTDKAKKQKEENKEELSGEENFEKTEKDSEKDIQENTKSEKTSTQETSA